LHKNLMKILDLSFRSFFSIVHFLLALFTLDIATVITFKTHFWIYNIGIFNDCLIFSSYFHIFKPRF
jgi:hypothetical protein